MEGTHDYGDDVPVETAGTASNSSREVPAVPPNQTHPGAVTAAQLAGWYGSAAIAGAYLLLTIGVVEAGVAYHLLNLTGALGIIAVCLIQRTWPPLVLNVFWALVAIGGLWNTTAH